MCIWCDKDSYTGNVTSIACEEEIYSAKVDLKLKEKEVEQLKLISEISSLVLLTTDKIIEGKEFFDLKRYFMFENRMFKITIEEVE